MSATISFGGLMSGLDTQNIVDQMVSLRRMRNVTPIQQRIKSINDKSIALKGFRSLMNSMKSASESINDIVNNPFQTKDATSSDTSLAVVDSVTSLNVIAGTYKISSVTSLAQPDRVIFDGEADSDVSQFGTGTISIGVGGSASVDITIDDTNNTLEGIMSAINSADTGVTASVVNDGDTSSPYRLTLTSNDSGAAQTITHNINTALTGLAVDAISSDAENEPLDAVLELNGMTINSSSNTITDAIPGVSFTLLDTSASALTITAEIDNSNVTSKIQDFVNTYNSLSKAFKDQFSWNEDSKSLGILGTNFTLKNAQVDLASMMTRQYNELSGYDYQSISSIGITMNEDTGSLEIDTAKLESALSADLDGVTDLFRGTSTVEGITERTEAYLENLTDTYTGVLWKNIDNNNNDIVSLTSTLLERQGRLVKYEDQLREKFISMEMRLASLETESQFWEQQTAMLSAITAQRVGRS